MHKRTTPLAILALLDAILLTFLAREEDDLVDELIVQSTRLSSLHASSGCSRHSQV